MAVLIYEHPTKVTGNSANYIVYICAEQRTDGTWEAWLEFHPIDKSKAVLRTGQETSQPNREAAEYWALGLEPVYLEGALVRARERAQQNPTAPPLDQAS